MGAGAKDRRRFVSPARPSTSWRDSHGNQRCCTKEIMRRLGHASPRAALIYQHATEDRDKAIAAALAELRPQSTGSPDRKALCCAMKTNGRTAYRPCIRAQSRPACRTPSPPRPQARPNRIRRQFARPIGARIWPLTRANPSHPQRDSNPCFRLERAMSSAAGRWGLAPEGRN